MPFMTSTIASVPITAEPTGADGRDIPTMTISTMRIALLAAIVAYGLSTTAKADVMKQLVPTGKLRVAAVAPAPSALSLHAGRGKALLRLYPQR